MPRRANAPPASARGRASGPAQPAPGPGGAGPQQLRRWSWCRRAGAAASHPSFRKIPYAGRPVLLPASQRAKKTAKRAPTPRTPVQARCACGDITVEGRCAGCRSNPRGQHSGPPRYELRVRALPRPCGALPRRKSWCREYSQCRSLSRASRVQMCQPAPTTQVAPLSRRAASACRGAQCRACAHAAKNAAVPTWPALAHAPGMRPARAHAAGACSGAQTRFPLRRRWSGWKRAGVDRRTAMCLSHAASGPAQAGAASAGRRSRRISANAHPAAQRLCASGPARPAPGGGGPCGSSLQLWRRCHRVTVPRLAAESPRAAAPPRLLGLPGSLCDQTTRVMAAQRSREYC
jgi:hypothetical protein